MQATTSPRIYEITRQMTLVGWRMTMKTRMMVKGMVARVRTRMRQISRVKVVIMARSMLIKTSSTQICRYKRCIQAQTLIISVADK
jgi:hypothetical protein